MLDIGSDAPEFIALADDGEKYSFSNFQGNNIVLYFYPRDDTPGCTTEAKEFASMVKDFLAKDTIIMGISKDGHKSHFAFKKKYNIPFLLLSDPNLEIAAMYGVAKEKSMFGKQYLGIDRSTFIISKERKILKIWYKVKPVGHAKIVLEALGG